MNRVFSEFSLNTPSGTASMSKEKVKEMGSKGGNTKRKNDSGSASKSKKSKTEEESD